MVGGAYTSPHGSNSVSESMVSNTKLSESFGPHRVPGRDCSEFLLVYDLRAKGNSPNFSQNSPILPQLSLSSQWPSALKIVFRPFRVHD